ncbi:MAG: beta-aspartyl-peptidase [Clostridiales bacterium]|nr:beta-aspartyl-peptidase [Clostridiales bacterium]
MKLELGYIPIHNIQFGDPSRVEDGVLYVNAEDIKTLIMKDERVASAEVELARPGESVRITPVKDVVEPRVKVDGPGGLFPGTVSRVKTVGSGKTHVLKGAAVVTTGRIVGFQEGIIDMSGPGAQYTPFSKTNNIVLILRPRDELEPHEHEVAVRMAGLKTAAYLGELARNLTPETIETFETLPLKEGMEQYKDLPRVGYVQMLQSQGLLHDTYVYGVDAKQILPTILYPTEVMDGAIISGNCVSACDKNPTYVHQNNPIVHDLFARHGKDFNFCAMIITNENVYLADKARSSDWTAKLCEFLSLDGVIVSEEGFGNPDTDLMMNARKITDKGIKIVLLTDEYAGQDGSSQSLADAHVSADAVVSGGNANQVITLPRMGKVIGSEAYVGTIAGGWDKNKQPDGTIMVELQAITGATSEVGFGYLSAR